jgi:hypothetical protein
MNNMARYGLDEYGDPNFVDVDFWGDSLYEKVSGFGRFLFGELFFYLTLESVQAGEARSTTAQAYRTTESVMTYDTIIKQPLVYLGLEVLRLYNTILNRATTYLVDSVITADIMLAQPVHYMVDDIEVVDTRTTTVVYNILNPVYLIDPLLFHTFMKFMDLEIVNVYDTLIKNPLVYLTREVAYLTNVRLTLVTNFRVPEVMYLEEFTVLRTISKTFAEMFRMLDLIYSRNLQWMLECLYIGDTRGPFSISKFLTDVIYIVRDGIPIDPFHMGRVQVIITTYKTDIANVIDDLIASPTYLMVLETITLSEASFVKQVRVYKNEIVMIYDTIIKSVAKYPIEEMLTFIEVGKILTKESLNITEWGDKVINNLTPLGEFVYTYVTVKGHAKLYQVLAEKPLTYVIKFEDEVITLVDLISHPFLHYLVEIITLPGSIYKTLTTTYKLDGITISDIRLAWPLKKIVEILNVFEATIISTIIKSFLEKLSVYESIIKHPNLTRAEIVTVNDLVSLRNIIQLRVLEVLNVIDTLTYPIFHYISEIINLGREPVRVLITKYQTERINIIDELYSLFGVLLIESLYIKDAIVKMPMPFMNEILYTIDNLITVYSRILTEIVNLGDVLINSPTIVFAEVIYIKEIFARSVTRYIGDYIKLFETMIKRPMKYGTLEGVTLADTRQVSILHMFSTEVVTLADALMRNAMMFVTEQIRAADIRCSRGVSAIRSETLIVMDILRKELPISFLESILLSDVRTPVIVSFKSEALQIVGTITKAIESHLWPEMITLVEIKNMTLEGLNLTEYGRQIFFDNITDLGEFAYTKLTATGKARMFKVLYESPLIYITKYVSDTVTVTSFLSENVLARLSTEIVALAGNVIKIMPAQLLVLETIVLTDMRTWFNNIIHRLDTSIRQFTDIKAGVKTTKETKVKQITQETTRE